MSQGTTRERAKEWSCEYCHTGGRHISATPAIRHPDCPSTPDLAHFSLSSFPLHTAIPLQSCHASYYPIDYQTSIFSCIPQTTLLLKPYINDIPIPSPLVCLKITLSVSDLPPIHPTTLPHPFRLSNMFILIIVLVLRNSPIQGNFKQENGEADQRADKKADSPATRERPSPASGDAVP